MGRREDRERLQSTWSVYEAREPGRPFTKHALSSAEVVDDEHQLPDVLPSDVLPFLLIARGSR